MIDPTVDSTTPGAADGLGEEADDGQDDEEGGGRGGDMPAIEDEGVAEASHDDTVSSSRPDNAAKADSAAGQPMEQDALATLASAALACDQAPTNGVKPEAAPPKPVRLDMDNSRVPLPSIRHSFYKFN